MMMVWLSQVLDLFQDTLNAIFACAPLQLFLGALVFLTTAALLMYILHQGHKGKL